MNTGPGNRTDSVLRSLARTSSHKFQSAPFACPVVLHNSNTFGYCLPLLLLWCSFCFLFLVLPRSVLLLLYYTAGTERPGPLGPLQLQSQCQARSTHSFICGPLFQVMRASVHKIQFACAFIPGCRLLLPAAVPPPISSDSIPVHAPFTSGPSRAFTAF